MIPQKEIIKINDFLWEIPRFFRKDMRVPVRIYLSEEMFRDCFRDRSLEQLINVSTLPGIQKYAIAMPDIHEGYSSPIGGVAAIRAEDGIISPGMCGYDINCGMKLLKSKATEKEIGPFIEKLAAGIQQAVPFGLGRESKIKLSDKQINGVLKDGIEFLMKEGYAQKKDLENCEARGKLIWADSSAVSSFAKNRGKNQLGTLGSGNHFLEVQRVDKVFDDKIARAFDLFEGQIVIMIHCGSRGLGHQVCTDYLREFIPLMEEKYKINVPDREFACVPFNSSCGQRYFSAMACAANYAWANRQMIAHYIQKTWMNVFGRSLGELTSLYDVAHNIIKKESYMLSGKETELIVHRKGATRAFGPKNDEIPEQYKSVGQPVLIPGSMGTASYVLAGQESARESFFSTCHGSGRVMSRHEAMRRASGYKIIEELKEKRIIVKYHNARSIAQEAPLAYKNVDEVVDVVHNAGLSKRVAKLIPLAVIKGE